MSQKTTIPMSLSSCYATTLSPTPVPYLSRRMDSVFRSFSSQVSLSSAMIFSVSYNKHGDVRDLLR